MEISVIVAAYNEQAYIKRCLTAILNQTVRDFELLVVDDYSADKTRQRIEEIEDGRIRYIKNDRNYGVAEARNIGIKQAKGKYIFFTDADCMPTKYWLEEGYKILSKNECAGAEGRTFYATARTTISDRVVQDLTGRIHSACNIAYRKEILDKIGGFNPRYSYCFEDQEIAARILKYGKIIFSEDMIVVHQQKKYTVKGLFKEAEKKARDSVYFIKNHRDYPDNTDIRWRRILYPKKLLILFFPFLLPFYHSIKNWQDVKLIPFIYLSAVYFRLIIWKEALKEKILLV